MSQLPVISGGLGRVWATRWGPWPRPSRRGLGWSRRTAFEKLTERGWREVVLWVLPENRRALAFYARYGFTIEEGVEKREERSGRPVIRLRASLPPASSS